MRESSKSIMIVAAEASSAHYAEKLIKEFKRQDPEFKFFGVGNQAMEKMGFARIGKSEEMAVVGLTEVIKHLSFLKQVFNKLLHEAQVQKPQAVILMDYPDFNLRLAKKLHQLKIPVYYYISPQIWAWRKSRIFDIKKYCRKVFLLFPFEKPFYDRYQVPNEFVGHPLLEDLKTEQYRDEKNLTRRGRYGITNNEIVLGLMPGSRHGEIENNFAVQLQTAKIVVQKHANVRLMIFVAPTLEKEHLLPYLENFKSPYVLIKEDPNDMISMADLVLVASGTATLMVGLLRKPMVIMYRMSRITYHLAQILVRGVKAFGLINLVHGKKVVPECLQNEANPKNLSKLLNRFIEDSDLNQKTIETLKKTPLLLGGPEQSDLTPTAKVVNAILKETNPA